MKCSFALDFLGVICKIALKSLQSICTRQRKYLLRSPHFNMKIALIILAAIILGVVVFFSTQDRDKVNRPTASNDKVIWTFDGQKWQANGTPPACPEPSIIYSPVNLSLVSGILYPGQLRGGDYKPHGGFRFDNSDTNEIEVRAIMDGYILKVARYQENGEVQNLLSYVNDCGIMVMHDHLLTLSPRLQETFDMLIIGHGGDSRTTNTASVNIKKGEVLATEVGFRESKNIFVGFGLYDLRKTNGVNYSSDFRAKNPNVNEYGTYALCWFDYLVSEDEEIVRKLPAGGNEGKTSDYCK